MLNNDNEIYHLVDNFKMALYNNVQSTVTNVVNPELKSTSTVKVKADIIFVGTLQWCKEEVMEYSKNMKLGIQEKDIQWVLTVPAIWDEKAKGLMKQWAQQANLWSPSIPDQLIIALEPECASIAMMLEIKDTQNELQTGDCYMVMDLGAGTADMVCHAITGPLEVREMIASFGGPWGSSYIDQDIIKIFDEFFGEDNMQTFQKEHRSEYLELLFNIEKGKCCFFRNKKQLEQVRFKSHKHFVIS
ncbi:hypothetical protein RFI_27519 [Reticulomyxa filosa]|uniref:Heat shock protein 70 n=1 Tax=Reticulomyxa filosa TaxID=46433 RepID=X6M7H0_RETFI|nr:hypothetical protein RFI_27519 [Reticulomyxa filosa]|eukprot:ETO09859.1 hypothetical protein RFI_27519 [Reticulomyxa filosa]